MADAGGIHRTKRVDNYSLGNYNGVTFVNSSNTFHATGSNAGAGFIVENATNVTITLSDGSTIPGSTLNVKELYPDWMENSDFLKGVYKNVVRVACYLNSPIKLLASCRFPIYTRT